MIQVKATKMFDPIKVEGRYDEVECVPGTEAFFTLRKIINEALRPHGLAIRFLWSAQVPGEDEPPLGNPIDDRRLNVTGPPYAYFVRRDENDDQSDLELLGYTS